MSESTIRMARPERPRFGSGRAQWYGIVVPALAMLAHLGLGYALVPWSCAGRSHWALHVNALILLLVAASGALVGAGQWRRVGDDTTAGDDRRDERARARFMGALGIASGALFSVAIAAQWLATVFISPCWSA